MFGRLVNPTDNDQIEASVEFAVRTLIAYPDQAIKALEHDEYRIVKFLRFVNRAIEKSNI